MAAGEGTARIRRDRVRRLCLLCLAMLAGPALAEPGERCYVFWASECFEIRDARTRDISHHVLITRGPRSWERTAATCEQSLEAQLNADQRAQLLEDFNDIIEDIDSCDSLKKPPTQVFENADDALERYRRLTRPGGHKEIHEIDPPRPGG